MTFWASVTFLFAEGDGGGEGGFTGMFLPMVIAMAVFFYFIVIRGNQRDKKRRKTTLDSLKKNDRVVTIGGLIGTVFSISADQKEVTLKIDDNAKLKVLRSAIQGPVNDKKDDDKKDEQSTQKED